jgi:capsular exopolysaccharide synthesis family protein
MEGSSFREAQEEQTINLRDILIKCSRYWYWLVTGLILAMAAAYLYIRYATPVYDTNAELLIKDDKSSGIAEGDLQNDILGQLSLLSGNSNVQNEMAILQSRTIVERAVRDLGLRTSYFVEGRVKSQEIYTKTPVLVTPLFLKDSLQVQHLNVKVNQDRTYTLSDDNSKMKVMSGKTATLSSGIYLVRDSPKKTTDTAYNQIQVIISPIRKVVSGLQENLTLSQTDKTSSVIKLTLKTTVPKKGEDFLNSLIREYSLAGLADKNQTAANTINFVDSRLDSISGELSSVEDKLEHFLSANSIANIDEQSKLFIDQAGQLDQQIVQQNMQLGVLKQIQQYVSQPEKAHNLVPSTLGIQDPTLVGLVQNYNELQLKRSQQISAGAGPDNPLVTVMDEQLSKVRNDIKENVGNLLQGSNRVAAQLQQQNQDFESKIQNVPKVQRDYITIKRQQDIKQTLYVYLLQKREQAAITEAASVYNNRVIDSAKTSLNPISPKKRLIYLIALILGLAIPACLIYVKELLNRRITSRQDVEARTEVPVFAEIGHSKAESPIVVVSGSKGAIPEQLRNLRTNLSFVLGTGKHKVILITSSMGGEGKSFVSLNLAMTYALMGKRTVLLGVDLRKPKIGNYVGLESHPGISNYLSGQIDISKLPVELNFGKHNLYFINSGPIPPNPAELILQPEMDQLMDYLKKNFEYIILDTPPVGLVTDAQILGKYADTSLYIVRHQYTLKDQIKLVDSYYKGKRMPKLGIVLNDIKAGEAYRYGYGGYGYGYGNGYYSESEPQNRKSNDDAYEKLKRGMEES